MNLLIMDTNFNAVSVVEGYESFIWTDRYNEYGDFEIKAPVSVDFYEYCVDGYYLWCDESDHMMIIEQVSVDTDVEDGDHFTITGRSLESILDRRIIWKQVNISGSLQDSIKSLLNDAIISPSDSNRQISNFIFEASTDEAVTGLSAEAQYTGDSLYSVIADLCQEQQIGFKVLLNSSNQFVFSLYNGTDRSYEQTKLPYVIFSPNFENIINSNYYESTEDMKNVALVGGEGDGAERKYYETSYDSGTYSGLSRREMFVDASGVSSKVTDDSGNQTDLTTDEYNALLKQEGAASLAKNVTKTGFEGEVDTTLQFTYDEDFFIGDIVEVQNAYGKEGRARVSEVVISHDVNGMTILPTFVAV